MADTEEKNLESSHESDYSSSDESEDFIITGEKSIFPVFTEDEISLKNSFFNNPPKTKNEIIEIEVELPNIKLDDNDKIHKLGKIKNIVGRIAIIEAYNSQPALDIDSLLCLEDKTVIGRVLETFGTIDKPHYTFLIPKDNGNSCNTQNKDEPLLQNEVEVESNNITVDNDKDININEKGNVQTCEPGEIVSQETEILEKNTNNETNKKPLIADIIKENLEVYYVESHSSHVYPEKVYTKGYDASDVNDEELSESDQEFSDDEKEALHKAKKKAQKRRKLNKKNMYINPKS